MPLLWDAVAGVALARHVDAAEKVSAHRPRDVTAAALALALPARASAFPAAVPNLLLKQLPPRATEPLGASQRPYSPFHCVQKGSFSLLIAHLATLKHLLLSHSWFSKQIWRLFRVCVAWTTAASVAHVHKRPEMRAGSDLVRSESVLGGQTPSLQLLAGRPERVLASVALALSVSLASAPPRSRGLSSGQLTALDCQPHHGTKSPKTSPVRMGRRHTEQEDQHNQDHRAPKTLIHGDRCQGVVGLQVPASRLWISLHSVQTPSRQAELQHGPMELPCLP